MLKSLIRLVIAIILIFSFIYILANNKLVQKQIYRVDYIEYVEKYSREYEVDSLLVFSIIKTESNFKEDVVSRSGAIRTYATDGPNSKRSCR